MNFEYKWTLLSNIIPKDINTLIENLISLRTSESHKFSKEVEHPSIMAKSQKEFFENANLATEEILKSIKNELPIIIHGDYDVDGQTATSILWRTIYYDLDYKKVFPYIPNRFDEGYGLSEESLQSMKKLLDEKNIPIKDALIITVDCGITAIKETKMAKEMGFKIIISDHHHEADQLPEPDYLVWTTKATGAGIAWILSYLLLDKTKKENPDKYLDLAALGTICDLQPLVELNRSISKFGLNKINENPSLGIKVLKEISEIKSDIDTYHLGWVLGPKLNATGRLESAMNALRLLCTEDYLQATEIAKELDTLNKIRQEKTITDFNHANLQISETISNKKFLIVKSENYHEGIIGLVAGKLVQRFYKPSIAIAIDKTTGLGKGSARSIEGLSIIEALNKFNHLFEKVGGHEMAAGFTIKESNIEKLNESLNSLNDWDEETFLPKLKIDLEISSNFINEETYKEIKLLSPFGPGNKEPIFLTKSLKVFNISRFGKENQHVKIFLTDKNNQKFNALIFNISHQKDIKPNDIIDVVYKLTLNEWNGNKNIELSIQDFH